MTQPNLAKGEEALYSCAECGEPVFLVDGVVYKPCGHTDAAVLANLQAILRGTSEVS
jgi:uncharacterized Zn finger protein (UPF0148 family)